MGLHCNKPPPPAQGVFHKFIQKLRPLSWFCPMNMFITLTVSSKICAENKSHRFLHWRLSYGGGACIGGWGGLGDFAEFRIGKEEHRGKETEKQAADLKRISSADTLCDCPKGDGAQGHDAKCHHGHAHNAPAHFV